MGGGAPPAPPALAIRTELALAWAGDPLGKSELRFESLPASRWICLNVLKIYTAFYNAKFNAEIWMQNLQLLAWPGSARTKA